MAQLGLTQEEEENLKIICEFLFFDQYTDSATYQRFEQCFQPLFDSNLNSEINKSNSSSI